MIVEYVSPFFSSAGRPLRIRSNPCWKSSVVHLRSRWAVVVVTLEKSGKNPRNSHLLNQNRSTMVAGRIGIFLEQNIHTTQLRVFWRGTCLFVCSVFFEVQA